MTISEIGPIIDESLKINQLNSMNSSFQNQSEIIEQSNILDQA